MKKFYYHIVSHNSVLLSTLPIQMYGFAETCECGYKRNYSEVLKRNIVQIKEAIDDGYLYICSDDQTITRKILQYYFDALKTLYPSHEDSISKIKESTVKDFRRLQHNVSTYNAAIKDELENLLPIEDRQPDWRRMVASVENAIKEHTSEFAVALLKTYKNTSLIKSEMIVHDLIKSPIPHLEIHSHPIHKVVKLSFQPYFMEFLEKDIDLRWEDCHDKVSIDYSSISVVLGHIWNNAIKYACKNTSIYIKFDTNIHFVKVYISMTSLYVENDERSLIYDEGYSGKWAKIAKLGGHGIGMHYIKRLTEMNKGQFDVNFGDTKTFYNAIPYTENTFILILPKAN